MAIAPQDAVIILRRREVEARTGLSRSTIYERMKQGTFPSPIALGPRSVGWVEAEIQAFLNDRIAARDSLVKTSVQV